MARHPYHRRQDSTACGMRNHGYAGVYQRSKRDESGAIQYYGRFIPRFKPRREKLASGTTFKHNYLPLGSCATPHAAKTLRDIAAFYYGEPHPGLDLGNGQSFSIPLMSEQEKQTLHGEEKREWVSCKAKEVFKGFEEEKAARSMALSSHGAASSVFTSIEQPLAAAASQDNLQDSAFSLEILEDLQFGLGDGFPNVFDSHDALPWEESWSGAPTCPFEGDSIIPSPGFLELAENPGVSPQQASAVLGSEDIISSTMELDQQLVNFQRRDEVQRLLSQVIELLYQTLHP